MGMILANAGAGGQRRRRGGVAVGLSGDIGDRVAHAVHQLVGGVDGVLGHRRRDWCRQITDRVVSCGQGGGARKHRRRHGFVDAF